MSFKFFITGISTDVGKTIVSAIIAEALHANYWKPVQAGDLTNSDSIKVKELTNSVKVLPEKFLLSTPQSPHAAAKFDGLELPNTLELPSFDGNLIIEGAGGLLVPVNEKGITIADWAKEWNLPVIIVSRHYLGSINHTLLTIEVLRNRNIAIFGIIFVGDENKETESIIAATQVPIIARIPLVETISKEFILAQAELLKNNIESLKSID